MGSPALDLPEQVPGLPEAVQAVQRLGGVLIPPDAAQLLAVAALSAARTPMMAQIYRDIADNQDLNIPPESRDQLKAVGWYLLNAHTGEVESDGG